MCFYDFEWFGMDQQNLLNGSHGISMFFYDLGWFGMDQQDILSVCMGISIFFNDFERFGMIWDELTRFNKSLHGVSMILNDLGWIN